MARKSPLTVRTTKSPANVNGETLLVTIEGELGINTLVGKPGQTAEDNALDKALAERLKNPPALVVMDMTAVTYMASVGIGALLRLKKKVEAAGGQMRFVGTGELHTLLKHSHLEKVLMLHPTVEAAMGATG